MAGFLSLLLDTLVYTTSMQEKPPLLLPSFRSVLRLDGNTWNQHPLVEYSDGLVFSVDFHFNKEYVYWTKFPEGNLYRTKLTPNGNATNIETVLTTDNLSFRIFSVDWVHDKLYWVEWSEKEKKYTLYVGNLDGSMGKTLAKFSLGLKPNRLILDPYKGYIYFTTSGGIERIGMNGRDRSTVLELFSWLSLPAAIDYETDRIYYYDVVYSSLKSVKTDGTDSREELANLYECKEIRVYEDHVFWLTKKYDLDRLVRFNKYNRNFTELDGYFHIINDYEIFHAFSQKSGDNPCMVNNGGCSHLCLRVGNLQNEATYTCECPDKYEQQGNTCVQRE